MRSKVCCSSANTWEDVRWSTEHAALTVAGGKGGGGAAAGEPCRGLRDSVAGRAATGEVSCARPTKPYHDLHCPEPAKPKRAPKTPMKVRCTCLVADCCQIDQLGAE
eukprot:788201-Amphidinium_carterae.2